MKRDRNDQHTRISQPARRPFTGSRQCGTAIGSRDFLFGATRSERVPRCSGVSLIEMVIVIALISILSAVALPRWSASLQLQRVNQAASRIVADLSRAQDAAYNTGTSKLITFTVGSSQYQVNGVTALDRPSGPYLVTLSADPYQCTLVSVWGQQGTQTITFNGYGLPDKGGNIVVAAGGLQKTIVVNAGTGSAVIQ
jgi:prepilin-type N-terminal cleavage/methylation domain-containing protein